MASSRTPVTVPTTATGPHPGRRRGRCRSPAMRSPRRADGLGDLVDAGGHGLDRPDRGPTHGIGWQGTDRQLGLDRSLDRVAGQQPLDQALTDAPALEVVELHRDRIGELVVVLPHVDAEALAEELADRMLDEADEVVEATMPSPAPSGRAGHRGTAAATPVRQSRARAPARWTRSNAHGPSPPSRWADGSNGCSGWLVTTDSVASPPSAVRAVRSMTSSSSDRGTAGGRGSLVRSSAPGGRDDEAVGGRQERVEEQLAVLGPGIAITDERVAGAESSPSAGRCPGNAPSSSPSTQTTRCGHGPHRHQRAHGDGAGAEVGAGREPTEPVGEQRPHLGQRQRPRRRPRRRWWLSPSTSRRTPSTCPLPGLGPCGRAMSRSTASPSASTHAAMGRCSAAPVDHGVEPVDQLGEAAGEVDVAALDVVEREAAADQPRRRRSSMATPSRIRSSPARHVLASTCPAVPGSRWPRRGPSARRVGGPLASVRGRRRRSGSAGAPARVRRT